jgi:hypothetical protein
MDHQEYQDACDWAVGSLDTAHDGSCRLRVPIVVRRDEAVDAASFTFSLLLGRFGRGAGCTGGSEIAGPIRHPLVYLPRSGLPSGTIAGLTTGPAR